MKIYTVVHLESGMPLAGNKQEVDSYDDITKIAQELDASISRGSSLRVIRADGITIVPNAVLQKSIVSITTEDDEDVPPVTEVSPVDTPPVDTTVEVPNTTVG